MITKWKLANFKSVRNETELRFGPLTIFAGANSSGKSSCIQSILMISQTLSHRISSRSVVLNGALARLGQFNDLQSFHSEQKEIVVGWECKPTTDGARQIAGRGNLPPGLYPSRFRRGTYAIYSGGVDSVSCEIAFAARGSGAKGDLTQLQPRLESSRLQSLWQGEEGQSLESKIEISRAKDLKGKQRDLALFGEPSDTEQEVLRQSIEFDVETDTTSLQEIREFLFTARIVGCDLRHFLPGRLTLQVNSVEEQARILAAVIAGGQPRAFRQRYFLDTDIVIPESVLRMLKIALGDQFPLSEQLSFQQTDPAAGKPTSVSLRDWNNALEQLKPIEGWKIQRQLQQTPDLAEKIMAEFSAGKQKEYALKYTGLPTGIVRAVQYLDHFFTSGISYLGPLRDEPKALYPLPPSPDLADVGLRGEFTALDLHKSQYVEYIDPQYFLGPEVQKIVSSAPLETAVTNWLRYLGVADSVETEDKGKLGHELQVKTPGGSRSHDLTHAGVGLSQILPILVSSLLAIPDTTLVFEQPELHLNPRVQTRLGDFFLSLALLGKQCVIETHSEYLINRLRLRIASSGDDLPLLPIVKIYFVEKHKDSSTFEEVIVNEYGAISKWPDGFFDQSQDEAEHILRAATAKRQARRTNGDDAKRND